MGWITDNFGSVTAYNTWRRNRKYLYHVKLSYNSTSTILRINPSGITKMGRQINTHEIYLGKFVKITLALIFGYKSAWGGDILRDTLFQVYGIKSECEIEIVKRNKKTGDYDEYFTGIIDFTGQSYNDKVDENGGRTITVDLIETGDIQKLQARDQLKLNLYSNTSVGGVTVSDTGDEDITFIGVNYYRNALINNGGISSAGSGTGTFLGYYTGGSEEVNNIGEYFNAINPTNGKIYENGSGETRFIKFISTEINYSFGILLNGSSDTALIEIFVNAYNSSDVLLTENKIFNYSNTGPLTTTVIGSITNIDTDYITIPDGGYLQYFSKITIVQVTVAQVTSLVFGGGFDSYTVYEKSPTISNTVIPCYQIHKALKKGLRLIMDRDDCLDDTSYTNDNSKFVYYEYITSSRNVRGFPNAWTVIGFRELMDHIRKVWQLGMVYNSSTGMFKVVHLSDIYPDTNLGDLGVCKNVKMKMSEYYSEIMSGYDNDGDIEKLQGVQMTHLKATHSMDFPSEAKYDAQGSFIMSAIHIESIRRQQYSTDGLTDDKYDDKICYVYAPGGTTNQANTFTGWEGIEENYNKFTTPRQNLLRDVFLKGLFYKETGGKIRFVSNKKNVVYSVSGVSEQSDIDIDTEITEALLLPEEFDGEAVYSDTLKDLIDSYGWFYMTDQGGKQFKVHIIDSTIEDWAKRIKFNAKLHNG